MAKKQQSDSAERFRELKEQILAGNFQQVYVFMGEEPYYCDLLEDMLCQHVLAPEEKDFNLSIFYASDVKADTVVETARRYPVFAQRQLVILREAQLLRSLEPFEKYLESPAPETVLLISFTGKSVDKRTTFYKNLGKSGIEVFESNEVKLEQMWKWISTYLADRGFSIQPQAAALISESVGNNLRRTALELDKLIQALPEGCKDIDMKCVEDNIGISREFSAFELTSAIFTMEKEKAYRIAHHLGQNPKQYPIQLILGALFYSFSKLLSAYAYYSQEKISPKNAAIKSGVPMFRTSEFEAAMRNYSFGKAIGMITFLRECDFKSKSNEGGGATQEELLMELLSKIFAPKGGK